MLLLVRRVSDRLRHWPLVLIWLSINPKTFKASMTTMVKFFDSVSCSIETRPYLLIPMP